VSKCRVCDGRGKLQTRGSNLIVCETCMGSGKLSDPWREYWSDEMKEHRRQMRAKGAKR
jgi:DnaJ-class molecular chaperone